MCDLALCRKYPCREARPQPGPPGYRGGPGECAAESMHDSRLQTPVSPHAGHTGAHAWSTDRVRVRERRNSLGHRVGLSVSRHEVEWRTAAGDGRAISMAMSRARPRAFKRLCSLHYIMQASHTWGRIVAFRILRDDPFERRPPRGDRTYSTLISNCELSYTRYACAAVIIRHTASRVVAAPREGQSHTKGTGVGGACVHHAVCIHPTLKGSLRARGCRGRFLL